MKFFTAILLVAFVAIAYAAEEPKESVRKLEPINEAEAESKDVVRGRRGLAVAAYTAPFGAPVAAPFAAPVAAPLAAPVAAPFAAPVAGPVVAPVAAAAYTAPVPAAYTAPVATGYSYSNFVRYPSYAPYYSYPAVYV